MNKKLSMLLTVIATCGLLAGCGTDYYTKDSTVFVAKTAVWYLQMSRTLIQLHTSRMTYKAMWTSQ